MSSHPNVLLILSLTPDDLPYKTYRALLAEAEIDVEGDFTVGAYTFRHHRVMENDYEDGYQLALPVGSICLFDYVTYGYGEKIAWDRLAQEKQALEQWAHGVCERHHCTSAIFISANYW